MNPSHRVLALLSLLWTAAAPAPRTHALEPSQEASPTIPYYFIAIHNEPHHRPGGEALVAGNYEILRQMVAKADAYQIKLTLMFSPQWAEYITASDDRAGELARWKRQGHEIAAHHHSIGHGNWDGYTAHSPREAEAARRARGHTPEKYLGTLDDFTSKLRLLDDGIHCGCLNDEGDKKALPDAVTLDTCSGFANFGEPGTRLSDVVPEKGKNEYISTGTVGGIPRKWLCHFQTTAPDRVEAAGRVFLTMRSGVYGSVNHSSPREQASFNAWLEFLHARDPAGAMSRTVSEIVHEQLLPEKQIPKTALDAAPPVPPSPDLAQQIHRTVPVLKRLIDRHRAAGGDVAEAERYDLQSRRAFQKGQFEECLRLLKKAIRTLTPPDIPPDRD